MGTFVGLMGPEIDVSAADLSRDFLGKASSRHELWFRYRFRSRLCGHGEVWKTAKPASGESLIIAAHGILVLLVFFISL